MDNSTNLNNGDRPLAPFFVLWTGQAVSLIGSQAVQFALIWWLTVQTGSAAILATAAFVGLAPQILLGPMIGALVDRWNRKRILFVADAVIAIASAVLAALFVFDAVSTAAVFLILFVRSIGAGFYGPAMLASTSLMVPKEHLTRIQGLNQSLQGGLLIVAAPLGALLYTVLPMAGVMAVDVVSAVFALFPLCFIHVPQPARSERRAGAAAASLLREVADGFRYIWSRPGHIALLAMAAMINLFLVPAFSLLPLHVVELGGGAVQLGWMNAAFGVGSIVGGIALGIWGGFRRRIHTTLFGMMVLGAATIGLGIAPASPFALALGAILMVGVAVPLANGPIQALLQATVDADFQGRVFTLYGSLAGIMIPLGLALAAPVAEQLGVRAWYTAGGTICLLMGLSALLVPAITRIEGERRVADAAA